MFRLLLFSVLKRSLDSRRSRWSFKNSRQVFFCCWFGFSAFLPESFELKTLSLGEQQTLWKSFDQLFNQTKKFKSLPRIFLKLNVNWSIPNELLSVIYLSVLSIPYAIRKENFKVENKDNIWIPEDLINWFPKSDHRKRTRGDFNGQSSFN